MLGGIRLKVIFINEKTCFAYVSPKYCTNNEQSQAVQVLSKDKQLLLWVVFNASVAEGQIACNPIHSQLIGLREGSEVFVSPCNDVKILDDLYIDADSPDDQEILEHNVELLQIRLLDQIRLVSCNQKVVVWPSVSLPIIFTPKKTGLLVNNSKIIVKIDAFNSYQSSLQSFREEKNDEEQHNNIGVICKRMLKKYNNVHKRLVLRAVPIDSDGKKNIIHPYTVYIHEDLIGHSNTDSTIILATITDIPSMLQEENNESKEVINKTIDNLCVEIVRINSVVYKSLCHENYNNYIPTVLIPKSLKAIISIENGMKIILTIVEDVVEQPDHIQILTYSDQNLVEDTVIETFKESVVQSTHSGKRFLINNGIIKHNTILNIGFIKLVLTPEKLKFTVLNSESFRQCTVSAKCLKESDCVPPKLIGLQYEFKNYCNSMNSIQVLIKNILPHLYFEIYREVTFKGISEIKSNVLITGIGGSGKSTICHLMQNELTMWSYILQCRSLKGRKDIPEVIAKTVLMCQEHSPAVLICDDIDALLPADVEGMTPQDIAYYQRLAVGIKTLLQSCSGVTVLMTALSIKALHRTLRHFNGKPLFTAHFRIPELGQDERIELLKHLLTHKIRCQFEVEDDDVIKMAMDTSGHTARDTLDYLNKKLFKAIKKKKSQLPGERLRLVEPLAKDVEKASGFDIWGPVGGMHEVKQKLTECIFWPLMYPALFPSQSCGILLYGPPGSGKSHVGSCLARLAGMTMILVKGPELLSKYIGQSEQAVRDVFDKADMKRPSILFFDEFDSLAPKRGHDSTGVTDRVVNQLLARMDGAEGSARGAVIAASARPDLLDPALLRPGRLQHHIYCPMPTESDRYEVLLTLKNNVSIDESVDLEGLAERTEGFTAADLKALFVTAQLGSLENQLLSNANEKSEDKKLESVVVQQKDIETAMLETKPSLSPEQSLFYDMIYKQFRGEKLSVNEKILSRQLQKQRVTLA